MEERRKNVLTNDDRTWFENTVAQKISEHHSCPFTAEEVRAVRQVADIVIKMGNGNMDIGVEKFRDQNRFLSNFLSRKSVVAGAALLSVVGLVVIALAKTAWLTVQELVLSGGR